MTTPQVQPSRTVWVVGSLNMDVIAKVKTHTSRGSHEVSQDMDVYQQPGGHGANQAHAVYRASHFSTPEIASSPDSRSFSRSLMSDYTIKLPFDVKVCIQGKVGDHGDDGEIIKTALKNSNIDVERVEPVPNIKTGCARIDVDSDGVPKIKTIPRANGCLMPNMIQSFSPTPALVLVQMEIPLQTVRKVIKQAKDQNIPVIFNAAPYSSEVHHNLRKDKELFNVDHLILNANCADGILRRDEIAEQDRQKSKNWTKIQYHYEEACKEFHQLGAKCVVITMGSLGVVASYLEPEDTNGNSNQRIFKLGAKQGPGKVVDQTGASDAFIGAYAVEILRQFNLREAARYEILDIVAAVEVGIKAGGLAITKEGSFHSMPWREEIYATEQTFTSSTPFDKTANGSH